jgi:hypothetical protein
MRMIIGKQKDKGMHVFGKTLTKEMKTRKFPKII